MAEKTPTDKSATEASAKMVEDFMSKAQTQYLSVLTESQNLALDAYKTAYKTMTDTMSKMAVPGLPAMPALPFAQLPAQMVEGAFEFTAAVVENQRAFAKKVFETTAS